VGRGPTDFTGFETIGQFPGELGGEPGAGVEPVRMPVGLVREAQCHGKGPAGLDGRIGGDEGGIDLCLYGGD